MSVLIQPKDEGEIAEAVLEAKSTNQPIEVFGAATKRQVGRPIQTATQLSTESLKGITLYEPSEMVLAAKAGTTVAEIEKELARNNQQLAFEPVDLGPMLGEEPGRGTIGAVFAANLSGARRIQVGAARDHFLGMQAVSGHGELFKSGGRVMKNVTGYDLCRGLSGSWGTLAIMSEVTMKVLPKTESSCTLVYLGLTDDVAVDAMCTAVGTPYEVSGTMHLHAEFSEGLIDPDIMRRPMNVTALRLENFKSFLDYRSGRLADELTAYGSPEILDDATSETFWSRMRELSFLQGSTDPVWRVSTAPSNGARLVANLSKRLDCTAAYDWSGGLIWLKTSPSADAGATEVRRVVAELGGHATLIRADAATRNAVEVFHPMGAGVAKLTAKLKHTFDPGGILNPGRMYPGL